MPAVSSTLPSFNLSGRARLRIARALLKDISLGKTPAPLVKDPQEGAAEALYMVALALNTDGTELRQTIYLQLAVYANPNADLSRSNFATITSTIGNPRIMHFAVRMLF